MQGLLNCGKANLLLGCLEVSMEDTLHRAGSSLHSSASVLLSHTWLLTSTALLQFRALCPWRMPQCR